MKILSKRKSHTGCSETTLGLVDGAAGLAGCCMARLLGFQVFSWECSDSGVEDLKKLKLNMVRSAWEVQMKKSGVCEGGI